MQQWPLIPDDSLRQWKTRGSRLRRDGQELPASQRFTEMS
jgi:hypothetical protein